MAVFGCDEVSSVNNLVTANRCSVLLPDAEATFEDWVPQSDSGGRRMTLVNLGSTIGPVRKRSQRGEFWEAHFPFADHRSPGPSELQRTLDFLTHETGHGREAVLFSDDPRLLATVARLHLEAIGAETSALDSLADADAEAVRRYGASVLQKGKNALRSELRPDEWKADHVLRDLGLVKK